MLDMQANDQNIALEQLEVLYNTMAQGVLFSTTKGRIVSANPAAEKILGLPNQRLIKRTLSEVFNKYISLDQKNMDNPIHPLLKAIQHGDPVRELLMGVFNVEELSYRWFSFNIQPVSKMSPEHAEQVILTFSDVSSLISPIKHIEHEDVPLRSVIPEHETTTQFSIAKHFSYIDSEKLSDLRYEELNMDTITFTDLFDLDEIQEIQDAFAVATGVASIITYIDGTPITEPSNFTCLCENIIRKTKIGQKNCRLSDACVGSPKKDGPRIQKCLSGGLYDAGASIYLGDRHIANWLIGQVADESYNLDDMLSYATIIGTDKEQYLDALRQVKHMPMQQFYDICEYLYLKANQLSKLALKNVIQAKEIERRKYSEKKLNTINAHLEEIVTQRTHQLYATNHELEELNAILEEEIEEKQKVEIYIKQLNAELEDKILERTKELQELNAILEEEIMERNQSDIKNEYLSYHDILTGLLNRRFFEEELTSYDRESNLPISILVGDVNGLKLVNDAFGHDKGNELLQKTAQILQAISRKTDLVARWGGDEFIVFLPKTTHEEVEEIVARMKDAFSKEQIESLPLSISFGWETKTEHHQDIFKVLKIAEDYMYKHKVMDNQSRLSSTINTIINTLHEKNPREEKHSQRVSFISQKIGEIIGMTRSEVAKLKTIGLLHDIGKIAIDEHILNKPGKLNDEEYEMIKKHPDIGYRILASSPDMEEIAGYIMSHHERYDGKGYPKGLKGDAIPLMSRIITIADAYDAMVSERSYKRAMTHEEVKHEFKKHAGTQFDPKLARVMVEDLLGYQW